MVKARRDDGTGAAVEVETPSASPRVEDPRVLEAGRSFPLGATVERGGVNFSVYSRSASLIELLLFDQEAAPKPSRVIPLDPTRHRTYQYWHAFVPGLKPGQIYGFRASGRSAPAEGIRIAPDKVLLDPYGLAVAVPPGYSRQAAAEPGDNTPKAMKSIVAVHFPGLKQELLASAMKTFYDVRNLPGLKKKPSTSELLDWLKLLVAEDIPLEALQSKDDKVAVPPLVGALLKNEQDVTLFEKLVFMQRHNR